MPTAETILKKTNEGLAGNVCLYDAFGKPISAVTGGGLGVTLVGQNGMPANVIGENSLRVVSQDYLAAIAQGDISGHTPFFKLGFSPSSNTTLTTLWNPATEYVFPTSGIQMEVVSTSASDGPTGTGALTCHIHWLDHNYVEHMEYVTMNGITAVPTVGTDIFRINSFHVETAGSAYACVGTVSIRSAVDHTTVYSQMAPGFTRSRNSVYTVPALKTLYIADIALSAAYKTSGKSVRLTVHASVDPMGDQSPVPGTIFYPYYEIELVDGAHSKPSSMVLQFPQTTDIKVSVIGETLAICTSFLGGWLE